MATEMPISAAAAPGRRVLYALLVALLLLATTGATLHPYALDEHRGAHPCGICIAGSHGGAALLPSVVALSVPRATVLHEGIESAAPAFTRPTLFRARAPPV